MRGELDYPDPIYLRRNNEFRCFIIGSTVDQEDMPFLIKAAIIILDKTVQPSHTDTLVGIATLGYYH